MRFMTLPWKSWARTLLGILLIGVLLWSALIGYRLYGLYSHGQAVARAARLVLQTRDADGIVQSEPARELRVELGKLEGHVQGMAGLTRPPTCLLTRQTLWPAAHRLGVLGCEGLDLAVGLTATAWWAALELESAAELYGQVTMAPGEPFEYRTDPLDQALTRLSIDRERLLALRPGAVRLSEALQDLTGPTEPLASAAPLPILAVDGLLLAPELLGGGEERLFLVIVQNSDELRPTGGFLSSVVAVHMQGYRLLSYDYMSSYDVEVEGFVMPPAPEPLAVHMQLPGLVFRDANWSPDWPTSAQVLAALYQANHRTPVDAVIALDTYAFHLALEAMGPLDVDGYGVTITADNLLAMAETFWETPLEGASLADRTVNLWGWLQHRKDFGRDFVQAGVTRLGHFSLRDWLKLADALAQGTQRRHIQAWALQSENARADLTRAGWTGAIHQGDGDYLSVVDSNLGYNKADRQIERSIAYSISLAGNTPTATLRLTYRNLATADLDACVHEPQVLESYEALTQQCYWNYVRVLAPGGIELLAATDSDAQIDIGDIDVGVERGRASLGTLLVVPPGQEHTLTLTYQLPPDLFLCQGTLCRYELTVQKQAGTQSVPLTLQADATPITLQAIGWQQEEGLLSLSSTLDTDRSVIWFWRTDSN